MLYSFVAMAVAASAMQQAPAAAPAEDPIVCKSSKEHRVGTRVRKAPICKPKSEWAMQTRDTQRELRQIKDRMIDPTPIPGAR